MTTGSGGRNPAVPPVDPNATGEASNGVCVYCRRSFNLLFCNVGWVCFPCYSNRNQGTAVRS